MNKPTDQAPPKLYTELAGWWPLLSDTADYTEEAGCYRDLLRIHCVRAPKTVLELGNGSFRRDEAQRMITKDLLKTEIDKMPEEHDVN